MSLAHHGVLFLDELLELPRYVLDAMRQPLEDGRVVIARAGGAVTFPARFALIAAANPCPCGHLGMTNGTVCTCSAADVVRYRARLSGPLADRIDLHVTVRSVPADALMSTERSEPSKAIRARVIAARERQRVRYASLGVDCNARAPSRWLLRDGGADSQVMRELARLGTAAQLSARGFDRVIRVSRTIADLDGRGSISISDVHEAVRYRGEVSGSA